MAGGTRATSAGRHLQGGEMARRARRELGLKRVTARPIALLTKQLTGGKARFMEFAKFAPRIEPRLAYIVESYEDLNPTLRPSVSIDEICAKYQVDPLHFIDVVGEAALRYGNNSAILIAARRKLGLEPASAWATALLTKQLAGGKARFMEFARLAVHIEPGLTPVVESYEALNSCLRAAVSIDELCIHHGIDPLHFIAVVGEAALKYGNSSAMLIAALQFPDVITKSVKEALKSNGFKDREALMKHHGFIPTPHGTNISVEANAAARADASAVPESKGLPSFEQTMREVDEIIRGRE